MSHFLTIVLLDVPATFPRDRVEDETRRVLALFDENREVAEHTVNCYCVGRAANRRAREAMERERPVDDVRRGFMEAHPIEIPSHITDPHEQIEERIRIENTSAHRKLWRDWIAPYLAALDALEAAQPDAGKPNAGCRDCAGTGRTQTHENPRAKWDWWTIGGRWNGAFLGQTECSRRVDEDFKASRMRDVLLDEGNIRPTGEVIAFVPDLIPFAIVTPDGGWHERGHMGWWGIVADEDDAWEARARKLLAEHPSTLAVVVDCHI